MDYCVCVGGGAKEGGNIPFGAEVCAMLKCPSGFLRAFVFLPSMQALLKYSGRWEPRSDGHSYRIGDNPTFCNTILTLSCIFQHFKFQFLTFGLFQLVIKQMQHFNFFQVRRF